MPIIALLEGSVVLKGGLASCTCCETCCMYPAAGHGTLYDSDDLPDEVIVNGGSPLTRSGDSYGNTTDGVALEAGEWAVYVGGVRTTQSCLIAGVVSDTFLDYYTVTDGVNGDVTVSRISLCLWESADSGTCSNGFKLASLNFTGSSWLSAYQYDMGGGNCTPVIGTKTGNQNTPVGNYDGVLTVS